eukprot:CAMPEP_0114558878 /NCGR_PEP_ID=MMETSP0114-20121206/10623_1 /TAXON_ID=31324 /ORGANISM="Goniomonas sp, Strain m" /LENGTH=151 /DNA_ID=CAMNT_0001744311 /DNA_START=171 /DNA_END=626 /DNA_ORIENTATION=-
MRVVSRLQRPLGKYQSQAAVPRWRHKKKPEGMGKRAKKPHLQPGHWDQTVTQGGVVKRELLASHSHWLEAGNHTPNDQRRAQKPDPVSRSPQGEAASTSVCAGEQSEKSCQLEGRPCPTPGTDWSRERVARPSEEKGHWALFSVFGEQFWD